MTLNEQQKMEAKRIADIFLTPKILPCEFCAEGHSNDIGGWYDRKGCERVGLWNKLQTETDPAKRRQLRYAYELSCDTGD